MNFTYVKSGLYSSVKDKEELEEATGQKCRFGFNWWFWLPRLNIKLSGRYKTIAIMWLCFCVAYEGFIGEA